MGKRTEPVENEAYGAMCGRMIRALARRVAGGDVEDLRIIRHLRVQLHVAEVEAIRGLLGQGYSYADIAKGLGISRQAVHALVTR